ncbi:MULTISPECIES: ribose-phosphate pyrophosphokinase [unclassified Microbulbifer]|uniref:ribose-phosphate diphosphokinase n=1 Tax=unclassified Microbulbifer TaxID=2619833 RepID=UPI001E495AD9|nr:ribose-phosphate diphosphokinase [Microbulbifer sp. YPW16]UHQ54070.1 ribose-phosphate diphosphokinase [Microbulbifer sp. YPW16]
MGRIKLFSLEAGADLAQRVAGLLGEPLAAHEERDFTDGEHKLRPLDDVEAADVYLLQSLYTDRPGGTGGSVDDKLVRLLFFLAALRDAGAARVTAVIPYLCYARKDRRTKLHDPLSSRYLASLLEAMGCDCVVTVDVHNLAAFENAFRCRTLHLPARPLFVDFAARLLAGESRQLVVVSPDVGGVKRAEAFRADLAQRLGRDVGQAFVEKYRSGGELSGGTLVGRVEDCCALVIDDLIAGGGTTGRAAAALDRAGAARILALASHGQFAGDALEQLGRAPLELVAVTDTLPQLDADRLHVIECAPLLAEAIRRLHEGGPATELGL